jgi:hypothetical protein
MGELPKVENKDREIEVLNEQLAFVRQNNVVLGREIESLQEQLEIARTATSDTEKFRQRERKHAEAVMTGYSLAIHAMVAGMKVDK